MADNVTISAGVGTTIAADDIGGVKHQRVKTSLGVDGAATDAVGGAGTVDAGTQRVTLATDDSLHSKLPATLGQKTAANSFSTVTASDDPTVTSLAAVAKAVAGNYETVAASQTDQVLGSTGAAGDFLSHLTVVPATTSPGAVSIKDGAGAAITVFTGGANSVADLRPFTVVLQGVAATAWKVTTGANVSAIGFGKFT